MLLNSGKVCEANIKELDVMLLDVAKNLGRCFEHRGPSFGLTWFFRSE